MNSLCKTICLMFAGISIFALRVQAKEPVTIESLLREMIDRGSVARYPDTGFRLKQHSSYNRESKTPEPPKMEPTGWFANRDFNRGENQTGRFIRTEENKGRTEWVIMEDEGPGAIVRSWMPWRSQLSAETSTILRIYVDGASEPVIEGNQFELFQGKGPVPFPLAHESLRSAVSFFPIPYAESCKVTVSELPFFYQFTYREYDDEVAVKSFTMDDYKAASPLIEEVCRTLLAPKVEAVGKTVRFSKTLAPDAEERIEFPRGVAAVRELSVKLGSYADPEVMRKLVLTMSFDGEDTVWCPLGDFFGSGIGLNPFQGWFRTVAEDGTMSSRWVMPYQKSGTVGIVNFSDEPISVELAATVGDWEWDERSMYFHAEWRGQYPVPTRPFSDWNYVTTKGRGVYVGDTLTIMNPVSNWWGEGDEKIFVDGEEFPSIFGTGTEDYYAYSWGGRSTDFYEHPFHAQPKAHKYNKLNRKPAIDEKNTQGYSVETRTRALDTMPFGSSLQLDMEVWSGTDCDMGYGVGVYWYGFPDTHSNRKPEPEEVLNIPPLPNMSGAEPETPTDALKGAVEISHRQVVTKPDSLVIKPQNLAKVRLRGFWNAGNHLLFKGAQVGDVVEIRIPASRPVAEELTLYATRAGDYGKLRFFVNGKQASGEVDLYSGKPVPSGAITLGAFEPVDGAYVLRIEVLGKKPKSKGTYFGLDCVTLAEANL